MKQLSLLIYAVRGCKYCNAALTFARNREIVHEVKYLDSFDVREEKKKLHGHRSWPIILDNSDPNNLVLIGGYTELVKLWRA